MWNFGRDVGANVIANVIANLLTLLPIALYFGLLPGFSPTFIVLIIAGSTAAVFLILYFTERVMEEWRENRPLGRRLRVAWLLSFAAYVAMGNVISLNLPKGFTWFLVVVPSLVLAWIITMTAAYRRRLRIAEVQQKREAVRKSLRQNRISAPTSTRVARRPARPRSLSGRPSRSRALRIAPRPPAGRPRSASLRHSRRGK